MKKSLFTLFLFSLFFKVNGQLTAVAIGCSGINVSGVPPTSSSLIGIQSIPPIGFNCRVTASPPLSIISEIKLEILNTSSGVFQTVNTVSRTGSTNSITSFTNLTPGVYRVSARAGETFSNFNCSSVTVVDVLGRVIGTLGRLSSFSTPQIVRVGQAQLSDITFNFKDDNGAIFLNNAFAISERVQLNITNNVPYTDNLVFINEFWPDGSLARFRGKGCGGFACFEPGLLGSVLDLTEIWKNGDVSSSAWKFEPGRRYEVWVVISNNSCISWTGSMKEFAVCPAISGLNCKENLSDNQRKVVIAPNPTNGKFILNNLNLSDYNQESLNLSIFDMSGKEIKKITNVAGNEFNVEDLNVGMYIVNLNSNGKRVFSSKLVLNR
jgi:Secretion system C-terminal sorting domain